MFVILVITLPHLIASLAPQSDPIALNALMQSHVRLALLVSQDPRAVVVRQATQEIFAMFA